MRSAAMKFVGLSAMIGALLLAIGLLPQRSFAQANTGNLVGTATDATGAVVPNAQVTITNLATSQQVTQTTNASGEYRFTNLPVGRYKVAATGGGLNGAIASVDVQLNKTGTANLAMGVQQASTTVEVSAVPETVIDTTTAQIQTTFETKQVQDLPTAAIGLGVLNLSLLNSGVATSGGIGAGTGPSISGQRPRNNNFTIEGTDDNDKTVTGPLVSIPNDAVGQFTVLQNLFSPEFGHSSGGQFNTVIVSGTNQFHGRAYEYFQNRNLNAIDAAVALSEAPGPYKNARFDNNRFGGQIGGPIIHDKLFFFQNVEYNPIGQSLQTFFCAPTAAGYAFLSAQPGISQTNFQVLQKYAGTAANVGDDVNCPSTANFVKPGATTGPTYQFGQVNVAGATYTNILTSVSSVDANLTQSDQIRGRYVYSKSDGLDTAANLPAFWDTIPQRFYVASIGEYHTFSPRITNELRLGFNRFSQIFPVPNINFPGLNVFPNLTFVDAGLTIGPDGNAPQSAIQNLYQLTDNISWIKGNHSLKFGFEGRKYISPQQFTQRVRGDYFWNNLSDYLFDESPTNFGERSNGNPVYPADQTAFYGYVNDDYRITPNFSLNAGIRYEFTSVPFGERLQQANSAASVPGLITFSAPQPQYKNYSPRLGFAYSPGTSGDTSIRGGFGMATDVLYDNLGILSLPPEFSSTCDVNTTNPAQAAPGCPYSATGFLANAGLPAGSGGLRTFPTVAAQRAATGAYVPNQKLPYSESWQLGVQHVFAKRYTAEVRYVGDRGMHLPVQTRLNRQSIVTPSQFLPTFLSAPTQSTLDALPLTLTQLKAQSSFVPAYSAAGFTSNITTFLPIGQSIYHGLQAQLSRSFSNGLQFQAAWTWSHGIDNSTADVFSTVLTPRRPQDFQNFTNDYTTSALDRRHRVTMQVIYDLPFYKHSNWFAKNVLGNWELAPIYTFQSPEFVTVQSGVDSNLNGDSAGDRTILNANGVPGTGSGVTALTNTAGATVAYLAKNPTAQYITAGAGALATAARNTLGLPHTNNWDVTAVKRINFTERTALEFQAQAFNVFNHSQYVPGSLNQVNSIGLTDSLSSHFLTASNIAFNNPKVAFSNQARTMQLALKFIF